MSIYHVSADVISSHVEINYGDRMKIHYRGTAYDTVINRGGIMEIYNGGYAEDTILSSGAVLMGSGGLVKGAVIHEHASANIYESCSIANATILKNGYLYVNGGAKSITVSAGGILYLESAGSATVVFDPWIGKITGASGYENRTTFLAPEADIYLGNDDTGLISKTNHLQDFTLGSKDGVYIYYDGTAERNILNGGYMVLSGGMAYDTQVNKNGSMQLHSGASVHSTTIRAGGCVTANTGTRAENTLVLTGGELQVEKGASASIVFAPWQGSVTGGGNIRYLERTANIYYGNSNGISSTFNAGSLNPQSGCDIYVYQDGVISKSVINNAANVILENGGQSRDMTISSGGALHVYSGASASRTTVNYGGYFGVGDGASTFDTTIAEQGSLTVWAGGVVTGNQMKKFGTILLLSGAAANSSIISSGGGLHVYSGATASNTTVLEGGFFGVGDGASTFDTTIEELGSLTVWAGGVVTGNQMKKFGTILLLSGAAANSSVISSGGGLHVYSGAAASNTTVLEGGFFGVGDGATTFDTTIGKQGSLTVWAGGVVNNSLVEQNGSIILLSGALADSTTVTPQGALHIYSGGTARNTLIASNAGLGVGAGGVLESVTLQRHADITFYDGSILTGYNQIAGSLSVTGDVDSSESTILLDLTTRTFSEGSFVDDVRLLKNARALQLSVSSKQNIGSYELAEKTASFDRQIELIVDGRQVGQLSGTNTLSDGSHSYDLNISSGVLALKIS